MLRSFVLCKIMTKCKRLMFTDEYIKLRMLFKHDFFHLKLQSAIYFCICDFFALVFHILCCGLFHFRALYIYIIIIMILLLSWSTFDKIKVLFYKIIRLLKCFLLFLSDNCRSCLRIFTFFEFSLVFKKSNVTLKLDLHIFILCHLCNKM